VEARAFHLAFVLPLVFFVYAMKEGSPPQGGQHLLYDVLYAVVAAMLNTAIFREILALSFSASAVLAAATFTLVLYFKQREKPARKLTAFVDFPIYTAMVGFLLHGLAGLMPTSTSVLVRGPQPGAGILGALPAGDFLRQ
jgi:hypothetical protein